MILKTTTPAVVDLLSPVISAKAVDPVPEADIWQRIRDGFQLDHHVDQLRVQAELEWFVNHPAYLDRVANRAERYLYHIVDQLDARGLPLELALLPVIESAFDPFAYSHGRASGLWQFIPSTGKRYGLNIDHWYDGRRDVLAATTAALDYLEVLNRSLDNDWLLALAAYNSGEGNVMSSMRKNISLGKPVDFFSLSLLPETRDYVPRLLAISILIADPAKYDIKLKGVANKPYWTVVDIGSQLDLAKAAELADITLEELYLLNPGFNKWSSHPDGPNQLIIPIEKADQFERRLASLPQRERLSWIHHAIKNGESLGGIADRYHTTVDTLRLANNIKGNLIRAGNVLLIPVSSKDAGAYDLREESRLQTTRTFEQRKFGAPPTRYRVEAGDNLWDLSRRFNVSLATLAKWNGMNTTDTLFPGKELQIFTSKPGDSVMPPTDNEVIRRVDYRVRNGESLSMIADKFNLSVTNIKTWNKDLKDQRYIQPGDNLTLYVDVTQTE
jgi:membrane-bound lytic murein transglycosylase D